MSFDFLSGKTLSAVGEFFKSLFEGKADSVHVHSKSDITDFPSSLPANGGNSATVNGHTVYSDVPANAKFTDTTYSNASALSSGLMSAADKAKLDGIDIGANKISVDSVLNSTGTNPVQNRAVYAALSGKLDKYTKIAADGNWNTVSRIVDSTNNMNIADVNVKKYADNSLIYKWDRVHSPVNNSVYCDFAASATESSVTWNFNNVGFTDMYVRVGGKNVFTDGGYSPHIVGSFSGNGGAVTVSGLSFRPSRILYYPLAVGDASISIAKINGNGFITGTTESGTVYEYIALR